MPKTRLYWLHCLSPTHAGIGRGVGYIDLPIDRDAVTNWPIIRGSSFKGVWADHFQATDERRKTDPRLKAAFGITGAADNESHSGALLPTDAKLVCLPVRSFRGTFAWASSPLCLQMLRRTLTLAGVKDLPQVPSIAADGQCHVTGNTLIESGKVYLEDLDFAGTEHNDAKQWAQRIGAWVFGPHDPWPGEFLKRFVILPDLAFDYLCETGTEVHTRVRIDDNTKTVAKGALWTEESLPAESILMGVIQCQRVFGPNGTDITPDGLLDQFAKDALTLQIGGKATVGRGQVRCIFREAN
ncbi:MAG: type III-B CRISPR module RAMP protein Cmr4 [Gemmataceae bacterium]|nr:type III-B CRISPR module RAMP protein Cmr4 [Gemmata sp.]MDW8199065.1 type III-B CRISPR module RAMP protein Cmr4 [Gemmataceae bacterium]